MAKSYEELKNDISAITNEVEDGANTANRIGGAMADIADFAKELSDIQSEETDRKVTELEASTEQKLKDLVVQETGDGEGVVMSQKAVTEKIGEVEAEVLGIVKETLMNVEEGSAHSSTEGIIKGIYIKKGSTFIVSTENITGIASYGMLYFNGVAASKGITTGTPVEFIADKDITEIGVYYSGSSVTQTGTISLRVKQDGRLEKTENDLLLTKNDVTELKQDVEETENNLSNLESTISGFNETQELNVVAGENHSSTAEMLSVSIKKGSTFTILVKNGTGIAKYGALYLNKKAYATGITTGTIKEIIAEEDITSIGIYYSASNITQSGTMLMTVVNNGKISEIEGRIADVQAFASSIYGYNITYDAYTPNQGALQILGVCDLVKGQIYKVLIKLAFSENSNIYCGLITEKEETITGSKTIISGTLEYSFDIIPEQNYMNAKIYISFYHAPQEEQSIIASISSGGIYDLIPEDIDAMNRFEVRTKEQMVLASNLGYARKVKFSGDYMPDGWIPQLVFLHISDTHQNIACANNAITALNMLSTREINKGNCAKFLIHTGDIKTQDFLSDFSYWADARSNANKPVYHVVGNHDCGLNNVVATSGSDEQVYACNTEPFIGEWNLTTSNGGTPHPTGKNYYFKDFEDEKIRLIVLYEYEHDMQINPEDTSLLLYTRVNRAFRQEQIDWLIDSLATTPQGWGVMIAKHQMEYADDNDNAFNSYFLRGERQQYTYVGGILPDIVQAFIDKTTINQSYQQTGAVVTTLVADADFSNTDAEFICYLSGHSHLDSIHYLRDYPKQLELTIGCDNTNYTHMSDMAQVAGTKTEDLINVCSVDRNRGYIYVVRIGADMSYTCQRRDILSIPYRK